MCQTLSLQGRVLTRADIEFVRQLIDQQPTWSRRQLSMALTQAWQWRNARGDLKDMACRALLVKLHERNYIVLPERRQNPSSRMVARQIPAVDHDTTPIQQSLDTLRPLNVINVHRQKDIEPLYSVLLSRYHYLGYTSAVGENMKYIIVDCLGRPLACLLFGSSAWSCASRDNFIGWDRLTRQRNIHFTTNNTRFLILPWVRVSNLASHVLAVISRRISDDWIVRYGHGVCLLETFVDQSRFTGSCYRAANWCEVGQTRGRGRNDRYSQYKVPTKSVFLYPLSRDFQSRLRV
jgi:hypothetical protein